MPDTVILDLYVSKPMKNEQGVHALLDVFRDFPRFAPTHWSSKDQRQSCRRSRRRMPRAVWLRRN